MVLKFYIKKHLLYEKFEVLAAVLLQIQIFIDVSMRQLVNSSQNFEGN